jgi:hypothetical protein
MPQWCWCVLQGGTFLFIVGWLKSFNEDFSVGLAPAVFGVVAASFVTLIVSKLIDLLAFLRRLIGPKQRDAADDCLSPRAGSPDKVAKHPPRLGVREQSGELLNVVPQHPRLKRFGGPRWQSKPAAGREGDGLTNRPTLPKL